MHTHRYTGPDETCEHCGLHKPVRAPHGVTITLTDRTAEHLRAALDARDALNRTSAAAPEWMERMNAATDAARRFALHAESDSRIYRKEWSQLPPSSCECDWRANGHTCADACTICRRIHGAEVVHACE